MSSKDLHRSTSDTRDVAKISSQMYVYRDEKIRYKILEKISITIHP